MSDLWEVIAELGSELHPDRVAAVASKIESLESVEGFPLVRPSFGPSADKSMIERLDAAWRNSNAVEPKEVAAALRAASAAAVIHEHRGSVELVWTGPSTGMVPIRRTEQVLCEVVESARNRLFLVSFVAYEVETITRALRDAIDRLVRLDVLLESSDEHGGKVTFDSVKAMKDAIPSANVYVWSAHPEKALCGKHHGAVHAKCAVADGKVAFITSANLSTAAMERNMELGVLVKGGHVPDELQRHLEALVSTGIVELV